MPPRKMRYAISATLVFMWVAVYTPTNVFGSRAPLHRPPPMRTHIIGEFASATHANVLQASADGINTLFLVDESVPSPHSLIGQMLHSRGMHVVDRSVWDRIQEYECYKTKKNRSTLGTDCNYANITSIRTLDEALSRIFEETKMNPLVLGYWGLDDWFQYDWDYGGARRLLEEAKRQELAAGEHKPVLCGFMGLLDTGTGYSFDNREARNFTPRGCDKLVLYNYGMPGYEQVSTPPADRFNWNMRGLLSAELNSFRTHGWNPREQELIGIVQAFGGLENTVGYWVIPTKRTIEQQSEAFCEAGAQGIVGFVAGLRSSSKDWKDIARDAGIRHGLQFGIGKCQRIWIGAAR